MKKILLLLTVLFSFSVNAQTVMWAIDLKDGAEDDYLKLEEFYSEIHKEGLKQGLRSGWSVWKRTPQEGDEANQAEYVIFDNFSSTEQMEGNGTSNEELAQIAYKGKMSKRAITKMLETTGSYSRERRTYVLEAVDYTILSGGNIKPGDKATINLMTKKTDDFESYESEIWKPIAEKNIMKGSLRQWVLAKVTDRSENAWSEFTHLAWNLRGNPDIEGQELSGFIWEKLWEGIESSRDMQDANEFTCVFAVN
tara:strand:- start:411 stop:1166 length:756 start_codon:yes stop_codon:yes gene_type:complete